MINKLPEKLKHPGDLDREWNTGELGFKINQILDYLESKEGIVSHEEADSILGGKEEWYKCEMPENCTDKDHCNAGCHKPSPTSQETKDWEKEIGDVIAKNDHNFGQQIEDVKDFIAKLLSSQRQDFIKMCCTNCKNMIELVYGKNTDQ